MDTYNLKILEFDRTGGMLNVAVRVKGPYSPMVRQPKVTILFDNEKETRRIPVLTQAYFPSEDLKSFTMFAKYTYNIKYLFFQSPQNKKINIWFEFTYGDSVIDRIPFILSHDVKLEEDLEYEIQLSTDMTTLTMNLIADIEETNKISAFADIVKSTLKQIWCFILLLIFIPLSPLFLLESVLAFLGLAKKAPKNRRHGILHIINHFRWRLNNFTRLSFGLANTKNSLIEAANKIGSLCPVKKNRIVFISNRRNDLTGNFAFIYEILKKDPSLDIRFVLDDRNIKKMGLKNAIRFGYYTATSQVILIDDFTSLLYKLPRREGTKLLQLWHACGAFKTFGYSRIGKTGGQKQTSSSHRNYDYAIVSSKEISKFYAEGFGISLEKAVATGIPRTDIFFDKTYKESTITAFYENYPKLREKKIILFAPTFRGNGKLSGHYPIDKFDAVRLYEELGKEYAILIKHHPFVQNRNEIPEEYQDYIIDLSDNSELNDLLFISDLLITDYSSVIFEAALLDIPMLFYAYDLQKYISTRGFYYEYEKFVPGKIVMSFGQLITAIEQQNFETEKINLFKTRFFDHLDGKSSQRVVDLIYECLK